MSCEETTTMDTEVSASVMSIRAYRKDRHPFAVITSMLTVSSITPCPCGMGPVEPPSSSTTMIRGIDFGEARRNEADVLFKLSPEATPSRWTSLSSLCPRLFAYRHLPDLVRSSVTAMPKWTVQSSCRVEARCV